MKKTHHILILDTGPLWELVLYRAVNELGFEKLRPELSHLRTLSDYQRLSEFIAAFSRKITTPQVVAEISAKIVRTEERGHGDLWGIIFNEFVSMGMDEALIKLLEMAPEDVAKYHAVDVSLLKLGESYDAGAPVVLSIDASLITRCGRSGVKALDLWQAIAADS